MSGQQKLHDFSDHAWSIPKMASQHSKPSFREKRKTLGVLGVIVASRLSRSARVASEFVRAVEIHRAWSRTISKTCGAGI